MGVTYDLDRGCRHRLGAQEAESGREVRGRRFRECSEMEGQEAGWGRRDPNTGPVAASADPVGALDLEGAFRVVLNWVEMAGSSILFPASAS